MVEKNRVDPIFLIVFILAGGVFLGIELAGNVEKNKEVEIAISSQPAKEKEECLIYAEERIVRGDSLAPLIVGGQTVKVLFDYYKCNKVERDDVVLYSFAGNEAPLIKIIRGIPGDKFNLKETAGGWNILINGKILENSAGFPYLISGQQYEMLALYERDYQSEIPDSAYLLLGNITSGGMDSTRFGLIHKDDILGKVEH